MIKSEKVLKNAIKTHNGTLCTPVTFYEVGTDNSLDGRNKAQKAIFNTYADVYNPSNKDVTIMNNNSVHNAVTIRIRDPLTGYQPDSKHFVELKDERYSGKFWEIVDIRPDFNDRSFLTLLLGGDNL